MHIPELISTMTKLIKVLVSVLGDITSTCIKLLSVGMISILQCTYIKFIVCRYNIREAEQARINCVLRANQYWAGDTIIFIVGLYLEDTIKISPRHGTFSSEIKANVSVIMKPNAKTHNLFLAFHKIYVVQVQIPWSEVIWDEFCWFSASARKCSPGFPLIKKTNICFDLPNSLINFK